MHIRGTGVWQCRQRTLFYPSFATGKKKKSLNTMIFSKCVWRRAAPTNYFFEKNYSCRTLEALSADDSQWRRKAPTWVQGIALASSCHREAMDKCLCYERLRVDVYLFLYLIFSFLLSYLFPFLSDSLLPLYRPFIRMLVVMRRSSSFYAALRSRPCTSIIPSLLCSAVLIVFLEAAPLFMTRSS